MCPHASQISDPVFLLKIALGNLTAADHHFLSDLIALFADPQHAAQLAELRAGTLGVGYGHGGQAIRLIVERPAPPTHREIINFMARFTELEWETVRDAARPHLFMNLHLANAAARQVLGYLPEERIIEVGNG